jgi:hypothetical protein
MTKSRLRKMAIIRAAGAAAVTGAVLWCGLGGGTTFVSASSAPRICESASSKRIDTVALSNRIVPAVACGTGKVGITH